VSKDRHHAVVAEFLAEVLVPTHVAGIEHQSRDSSILGQQLLEDGVIVPARPEVESQAGLGRRQELELGTHGIPLLVNTLMNATINTAAFASPTAKPHSHASGPAVFAKWPHAVPQSDPLPRGCGKTETARRTAKSEVRLDVDQTARQAATIDPALVLTGPTPRLVDEWQVAPVIWKASSTGQVKLTGPLCESAPSSQTRAAGWFGASSLTA